MARRSNFELLFPADMRGSGGVRDGLRTYTKPDNIVLLNCNILMLLSSLIIYYVFLRLWAIAFH